MVIFLMKIMQKWPEKVVELKRVDDGKEGKALRERYYGTTKNDKLCVRCNEFSK